jgi:hypothetical protein
VSLLTSRLLAGLVLPATPTEMGRLTAAGLAANLVLSPAGRWLGSTAGGIAATR